MAKTFEQALQDQLGMLAWEVTRLQTVVNQQAEELEQLRAAQPQATPQEPTS